MKTVATIFSEAGFPAPAGTTILNSLDGVVWLAVGGKEQYFFCHRPALVGWQPREFIQSKHCLDAKFRNVGNSPIGSLVLPEAVRKVVG